MFLILYYLSSKLEFCCRIVGEVYWKKKADVTIREEVEGFIEDDKSGQGLILTFSVYYISHIFGFVLGLEARRTRLVYLRNGQTAHYYIEACGRIVKVEEENKFVQKPKLSRFVFFIYSSRYIMSQRKRKQCGKIDCSVFIT